MNVIPFRLTICGIPELDEHRATGVTHIVSILDPEWPDPPTFDKFAPHWRLDLRFHDIIEPTPEGAKGWAYMMYVNLGEGDKPSTIGGGGVYEDEYVKERGAWKIKVRRYYAAHSVAGAGLATAQKQSAAAKYFKGEIIVGKDLMVV